MCIRDRLWVEQPDIRQPRSVTISATVDSLILYGQAFYQACSDLSDAMANNRLVHSGQTELVQHLNNCAAKTNDAGWRIIRRKSAGDVTAAISLAMVVSELTKPQRTAAIFV